MNANIVELKPDQIPASAFCHCPAKRFALVRIREACLACPHHVGFAEVNPRDAVFFSRHRPLCAHPIARAVTTVEGV